MDDEKALKLAKAVKTLKSQVSELSSKAETIIKLQGPKGDKGEQGKQGLQGLPGTRGRDGVDGKDGLDGVNGVGVAAVEVTFDNSLVVRLTNGSEIDAGQIHVEQTNNGQSSVLVQQYSGPKIEVESTTLLDGDVLMYDLLSETWKNMPNYQTPELEVQLTGKLKGKPALYFKVLGSRIAGWSSTAVFGDAAEYLDTSQAAINTPTTAQTLYLVSTSVNDTVGGTGAQSVRFTYLDTAGSQQTRTVSLAGTTPVNLGVGFSFIQFMEADQVGANAVASGNISITSINGAATVATTFERITAGGNKSLSGRFKVPTGYTALLGHTDIAAIGTSMDVRIRSNVFQDDGALSPSLHFVDRAFLASGQNAQSQLDYLKIPEGGLIKFSAIPGAAAAGNKLDVSLSLILRQN